MKVAVIGAGVMGPGIVQSWMLNGDTVALNDIREEALAESKIKIKENINLMYEKKIIDKNAEAYMHLLETTTSLEEAVKDAKLVIEAIAEKPEIKEDLYNKLDKLCPEDTVIVSNTSAMPLPDMFPNFRPENFFICHYFNPPEIMPLVEIVKSERTNDEVVQWLRGKLEECGKKPIVINKFVPGFLVNRIQTAMMREALYLTEIGAVSPEDLDTAITACIGFKSAWQGLFDTMDFIGLDTVALACSLIFPDLNSSTELPQIIIDKIENGELGAKAGKGFFDYTGEKGQKILQKRKEMLLEQLALWKKGGIFE